MLVHSENGDGVTMGVHAGSCWVGCHLAGSVNPAGVMDWQHHPLPAVDWVSGVHACWSWISLLLFNDVVSTVGAGVMLQQPGVHTLLMKPVSTGDDTQLLPVDVLLQTDGAVGR